MTLNARDRGRALALADFMLRRGIGSLELRAAAPAPGRTRCPWFAFDAATGEGTGHRLPPKAGPEIVRRANRLAALARRAPTTRRLDDGLTPTA